MQAVDEAQRERYRKAVDALAVRVLDALEREGTPDDAAEERAVAELRRIERTSASEHAWIFRDPSVLALSDNLFQALEAGPDGRRTWLHADLGSAVAAVARNDVLTELAVLLGDLRAGDEEGEPAAPGEA